MVNNCVFKPRASCNYLEQKKNREAPSIENIIMSIYGLLYILGASKFLNWISNNIFKSP